MVEVRYVTQHEAAANRGRRAPVIEDITRRYDSERHVSYDSDGATFFWSPSSVQADFNSTLSMAISWAEQRKLPSVLVCD